MAFTNEASVKMGRKYRCSNQLWAKRALFTSWSFAVVFL